MSLEDGNSGELSNQASLGSEPAQSSAAASSSSGRAKTSANGSSDGWIPDVGSVVLAKLKGFPQWPAMIVGEEAVNSSVLAAKPKSKKVWPVMFFNDNTFMWASQADLKELTPEMAQAHLDADKKKKGKKKQDKSLVEAYRMATAPPDYYTFINAPPGGAEKPKKKATAAKKEKKEPESNEIVEKASKSDKKDKKRREEEPPVVSNGPPPPPPKKIKAESGPKATPTTTGKTNGSSSSSAKSIPTAKQLKEDAELKSRLTLQLRHRLQKGFLSNKPDDKTVPVLSQDLKQLEEIPDLELSIIRQTKVNKVLKAILKIDDIPLESEYRFHERSLKLLEQWSHLDESAIAKPTKDDIPTPAVKDEASANGATKSQIEDGNGSEKAAGV